MNVDIKKQTFSFISYLVVSGAFEANPSRKYTNPVEIRKGSTGFFFRRAFFAINHEPHKEVLKIPPNGSFTYSPGESTDGTHSVSDFFIRGDEVILTQSSDSKGYGILIKRLTTAVNPSLSKSYAFDLYSPDFC